MSGDKGPICDNARKGNEPVRSFPGFCTCGAAEPTSYTEHVGVHDGAHFIEKPDPVLVLTGFKSMGPCAVVLGDSGGRVLVVTPAWDAARAERICPGVRVVSADDVVEGLAALKLGAGATGSAGIDMLPFGIASRLVALMPGTVGADNVVFDAARTKTDTEISHAREATRIAELGYARCSPPPRRRNVPSNRCRLRRRRGRGICKRGRQRQRSSRS